MQFEQNAFLKLAAHEGYWGGAPAYKSVIIKFVPDATSRVAEIDSGQSQVAFDIPYEEFDRLKEKPGLKGVTTPISDIAMIFLNDVEPMTDKNVRLAAIHAIDKQLLIDRLLAATASRSTRCRRRNTTPSTPRSPSPTIRPRRSSCSRRAATPPTIR